MKKSDAFPSNSKYFKASEFPDEPMTRQVETVRFEKFDNDGKSTEKPVVYFAKEKCGLVIGPTQWDQIVEATGEDDTDNWKGRQLELFKAATDFRGRTVDCIRIRAPRQGDVAKLPLKQKPTASTKPPPDMGDEIPF